MKMLNKERLLAEFNAEAEQVMLDIKQLEALEAKVEETLRRLDYGSKRLDGVKAVYQGAGEVNYFDENLKLTSGDLVFVRSARFQSQSGFSGNSPDEPEGAAEISPVPMFYSRFSKEIYTGKAVDVVFNVCRPLKSGQMPKNAAKDFHRVKFEDLDFFST
jgi:hypothetical protein